MRCLIGWPKSFFFFGNHINIFWKNFINHRCVALNLFCSARKIIFWAFTGKILVVSGVEDLILSFIFQLFNYGKVVILYFEVTHIKHKICCFTVVITVILFHCFLIYETFDFYFYFLRIICNLNIIFLYCKKTHVMISYAIYIFRYYWFNFWNLKFLLFHKIACPYTFAKHCSIKLTSFMLHKIW